MKRTRASTASTIGSIVTVLLVTVLTAVALYFQFYYKNPRDLVSATAASRLAASIYKRPIVASVVDYDDATGLFTNATADGVITKDKFPVDPFTGRSTRIAETGHGRVTAEDSKGFVMTGVNGNEKLVCPKEMPVWTGTVCRLQSEPTTDPCKNVSVLATSAYYVKNGVRHPSLYYACRANVSQGLRTCPLYNTYDGRECVPIDPCTVLPDGTKHRYPTEKDSLPLSAAEYYVCENGFSRYTRCANGQVFQNGTCSATAACLDADEGKSFPIDEASYYSCVGGVAQVTRCPNGTAATGVECLENGCGTTSPVQVTQVDAGLPMGGQRCDAYNKIVSISCPSQPRHAHPFSKIGNWDGSFYKSEYRKAGDLFFDEDSTWPAAYLDVVSFTCTSQTSATTPPKALSGTYFKGFMPAISSNSKYKSWDGRVVEPFSDDLTNYYPFHESNVIYKIVVSNEFRWGAMGFNQIIGFPLDRVDPTTQQLYDFPFEQNGKTFKVRESSSGSVFTCTSVDAIQFSYSHTITPLPELPNNFVLTSSLTSQGVFLDDVYPLWLTFGPIQEVRDASNTLVSTSVFVANVKKLLNYQFQRYD